MKKEQFYDLVKKAIDGDLVAFEELYEFKARSILYQTAQLVGSPAEAEDVAQEVVVAVYKGIANLKDPRLFNAWLRSIIVKQSYKMLKKRYNSKIQVNIEEYSDFLTEENKEFLPAEYAENSEMKALLLSIVNALPEKRREAVMLYYYEDMSYLEIAMATGTTPKSVSSAVAKAKKTIKKELEKKTGKGIAKINAIAAAPVLGQIFESHAEKLFPQETVNQFVHSCTEAVKAAPALSGGTAASGSMAKPRGMSLGAKIAAVAAAGVIVVAISAVNLNVPAQQSANSTNNINATATMITDNEVPLSPSIEKMMGDPQPPDSFSAMEGDGNKEYIETPLYGNVHITDSNGQPVSTGLHVENMEIVLLNDGREMMRTRTTEDGAFAFDGLKIANMDDYLLYMMIPEANGLAAMPENADGKKTVSLVPGKDMGPVNLFVTQTKAPDGTITLMGGDCECNHVNPKSAAINTANTTQSWQIVREGDGAVIYSGTGAQISNEFIELYNLAADGTYTIVYVHTDEFGNSAQIKKDFVIYTGEIFENQFK